MRLNSARGWLIRIARRLLGKVSVLKVLRLRIFTLAASPGVVLLPKALLDIREHDAAVTMPPPLSPQYGALAADLTALRLQRAASARGVFGSLLPLVLRKPRTWQLHLLARSHALARALTTAANHNGKR